MPKNTDRPIKSHMNDLCEQAGCTDKQAMNHAWKWERHRWHSHPLPSFVAWWEPCEVSPISGVSIGGHPEARRIWVRKRPGGWTRRWYGMNTLDAWNSTRFVQEFDDWQNLGSPEREPFVSEAAPDERQKEFWMDIAPLLHVIGTDLPTKKKLAEHFNFKELVPRLFAKYKVTGEVLPDWDKACKQGKARGF